MLDFEDLFFDGVSAKVSLKKPKVKTSAKASVSASASLGAKAKVAVKPKPSVSSVQARVAAKPRSTPRPQPKPKPKPAMRKSATATPIRLNTHASSHIDAPGAGLFTRRSRPAGRSQAVRFRATATVRPAPLRPKRATKRGRVLSLTGKAAHTLAKVKALAPKTKRKVFAKVAKKKRSGLSVHQTLMAKLQAKSARKKARARAKLRARFHPKGHSHGTTQHRPRGWLRKARVKPRVQGKRVLISGKGRIGFLSKMRPVQRKRTSLAARLGFASVLKLAKRGPKLPRRSAHEARKKAVKAITPIAQACKCDPAPVVKAIDVQMACKGYPTGTAKHILASIHDMNTALEKAAVQRLATHEHNTLSAQQKFERDVLAKLSQIAQKLPPCHPTRTRAHLNILRRSRTHA